MVVIHIITSKSFIILVLMMMLLTDDGILIMMMVKKIKLAATMVTAISITGTATVIKIITII